MEQQFVDLYKYWGLDRPEGGAGWLDCYVQSTPASVSTRRLRPGVLIIPGGGYEHVSAREGEPVALRFLSGGYCAFVLKYSVSPVRFPAPLQEAAMAMGYIRRNADALGVDPNMVAAIGFSAGGHLCGMLGTMFDAPEVAAIGPAQLLRPDALGLCYPVALSWGPTHEGSFRCLCGEDLALRNRLSLDKLVRPDMPPAYLWHTWDDDCVPCRNTLVLAQVMNEARVTLEMRLHYRGIHGISTADAQVFRTDKVPQASPGVAVWPEEMMAFFRELGLKIKDLEQNL